MQTTRLVKCLNAVMGEMEGGCVVVRSAQQTLIWTPKIANGSQVSVDEECFPCDVVNGISLPNVIGIWCST